MQNSALHCALGMESKVCLFSARPWDEANMLENLVRVHLLAKEKYQMVRIVAAEGPKIWCVGMYQLFIYHVRAIITRSFLPLCPDKLLFYFTSPGKMVPQQF